MTWTVYILRCADGTLYTGATNDLARRIQRHAAGKGARYTRSRLPVKLVYSEPAGGQGAALRRELAIKSLTRGEKFALVRTRRMVQRRRAAHPRSTATRGSNRTGHCSASGSG